MRTADHAGVSKKSAKPTFETAGVPVAGLGAAREGLAGISFAVQSAAGLDPQLMTPFPEQAWVVQLDIPMSAETPLVA